MWALLFLLLFQGQPTADEQSRAQELFALGVELYESGDAAGAVAAFEGAETTGWTSGMLHYNLGTAYLNLERLGQAILQLERAQRLMPRNDAVAHNLQIAREQAGVTDEISPWSAFGSRVAQIGGSLAWLLFAFVSYVFVLSLVGRRLWLRGSDAWSRRAITALAPVTVVLFVIALAAWGSTRLPVAIVVSQDAELRTSPSSAASSRATLRPGERIRIMDVREGWQEVRLSGGVSGWVPTRTVERI